MEKKLYPFKFIPVASPRPWGGNALVNELGKHFVECDEDGNETVLGADVKIGESWEIADMGIVDSVVSNGWLAGNTISELMETYMEKLPQITFFSNLIYCTAYGTVLSFILSRNIPSRDPFADYKPDQQ